MARLWARTTTYDSVAVGDELPILVKWETEDTIGGLASLVKEQSVDNEGEEATGADTGLVVASQALVSYTTELLEKGFPLPSIMANGSVLSLRVTGAVKPEDTISLSGRVVGKQQEGAINSVNCLILIENQDNVPVAEVKARIAL